VKAYVEAHRIALVRPVDAMRRAMVATVEAAAKKPVYHMSDTLDATLLLRHESAQRTVTVWLLKLFAEAMMRHEAFRTTWSDEGLRVWPDASVSLAVARGEALYMPVLRGIQNRSADAVAEALAAVKEKVRQRKLGPEDLSGSTFGLSNLGMAGIESFDAMINGDDCAIAAVGAAVDGRIRVTLTIDHRVVNGYQAAEFFRTLKTLAEDPLFFREATA